MYLQSHWAPSAFTGIHPQTNPRSKIPPQPFPPILGSLAFVCVTCPHTLARYTVSFLSKNYGGNGLCVCV